MVRLEMQKWGQSLDDLRRLALQAAHPRTRERFLALSLIADGTHNATTWAAQFGRQDDTVLGWVHTYNQKGPDALTYRRTGGPAPLLRPIKPGRSSRSSPPPSRSHTACPATAGR
jgi:Helix-turn-helix domain